MNRNIYLYKCLCPKIYEQFKNLNLYRDYYFKIKYYLKVSLRMQGSYKRLKKLKASKDLTQMVTTNRDFLKD